MSAKIDLRSPRLRIQNFQTEHLQGTIGYRKGVVDYHLEGDILGGRFQLEGQLPPRDSGSAPAPNKGSDARPLTPAPADVQHVKQAPPPPAPGAGRLRIQDAQLTQLWRDLGVEKFLGPLRGTFDLDLTFRQTAPQESPTGAGDFVVRGLRWDLTNLRGVIRGDLRLDRHELRFTNLNGDLGGGLLRGQVSYHLQYPERSWFNLSLDRVEASRLLAPWPDLANRIQGPLDLHVRGTLGREWFGSGEVALLQGKVVGVEVSDWRSPFDFTFSPRRGYGQLEVRDSSAEVARGRLIGRASLSWGTGTRLEGTARFFNVDLGTLLRQLGEQSQLAAGGLSGTIDFGSNDLRSVNDLTATLNASLGQAQGLDVPVLRQLTTFLGPGLLSTTFSSGDLRARLDGGLVRIQRLTLTGTYLQLLIQGTVTLEGVLNLDAWANLGQQLALSTCPLRALGVRIPATGPLPFGLILEASNLLANRLLHFRITGTIRSPSVRLEPQPLLSEEAIRFFLTPFSRTRP